MADAEMSVVMFDGFGGPELLKTSRRPVPKPGPGQILIEVHAAGVNRPDIIQRKGHYPPPPGAPEWPGLEVAGFVAAIGEDVERHAVGDRVMALLPGGGYAEYALASAGCVLPVPSRLSMVEAAAIPETFFTVWSNVIERGGLMAGESMLVHGGASGIGTVAVQIARSRMARVFATAGSDEKCNALIRLGADRAINYHTQDFVQVVMDATGERGVDVILDMIGGDYVPRNLKAAALDGRIVQIAYLRGQKAEVNLAMVMSKRLVLTGSTLRARDDEFKAGIAVALETNVWPLLEESTVWPVVDTVYALEDAASAHRHMDRDHFGKIVLVTARGQEAMSAGN
ncbi:NAD(P)H-quinone oxidoreductase [Aureimonas fodinaquatilis]|uniref:NAD(P)H-quinone oxidoreductase n=1 Tax=Aureimonas fodinaquatilis TaxID=2565783 RepID=A0A5B0E2R3_9HYPH|nr:NAD(P)H-quinone oxidoreductase [Aureimonas fodinaquatilis]KAA0972415.1 NAD(P)H-quinone oxidoreductase [Aureimonas fodinaquatilis]